MYVFYIYLYICMYIYEQETKQKTQRLFDEFPYFFNVMFLNGEIHNVYSLYINKNTITIAPRIKF